MIKEFDKMQSEKKKAKEKEFEKAQSREHRSGLPAQIQPATDTKKGKETQTDAAKKDERRSQEERMIDFLMHMAHQHLLPDEVHLAEQFILYEETELAIEFLFDLFIEHKIVFPVEVGDFFKEVAAKFNLSHEKSWEDIIVEEKNSHEKYRLYVGKDPLLIRQEVESILSKIEDKFDKEAVNEIKEYLEAGEYELALDVICSILYANKILISKNCLDKINTALTDVGKSKEEWDG